MKRYSYLLLLFCLFACQSTNTTSPVSDLEQVEQNLRPPVLLAGDSTWSIDERMKHYGVPGVSIAVIENFQVKWSNTYGVVDFETQQPVTKETLFQAASISKPVAAYGALKLVEMGKLKKGTDINQQLKSWQLPGNQHTDSVPIILEHLVSHTAGLTVHGFLGYHTGLEVPQLTQLLDGEEPANSNAIRVDQLPGSQFRYSGGGYCVLQQMVIDQFEDRSYPEIMKELVLDPVGMNQSTFQQPLPDELLPLAATGYLPDGTQTNGKRHTYPEMAAAGLWTTAEDLALFAIDMQLSIAGSRNNVLNEASVNAMTTPYFEDFVGLGIFLNQHDGEPYLGHGGWNEGFSSELLFHREKGYGVAVMINSNHPQFISELIRAVAMTYNWDGYLPPTYERLTPTATEVDNIVGRYQYSPDNTVEVYWEEDQLFLKYLRDEAVALFKVGENRYLRRHTATEIRFEKHPETKEMNLVFLEQPDDEVKFEHPRMADDALVPFELLLQGDAEAALVGYQELLKGNTDLRDVQEWMINRRGYELLEQDKIDHAIELFKINTVLYPQAFNTYDSLGEAYYKAGKMDLAIINYQKSLELNPENKNARDMLKKMAESS